MADATPDDADRRAAELTSGLYGLLLKYTWTGAPSRRPPQDFISVGGDGVIVLTERIAAAIREAERRATAVERERCAKLEPELRDRLRRMATIGGPEERNCGPEWFAGYAEAVDDYVERIRDGATTQPGPAWTRQAPTVPAWYWTRTDAGEVEPVLVTESPTGTWWANGNRLTEYADREWCGPIEAPT